MTLTLTQPGATALVNVTTDTQLTLSEQYMNLSGTTAANVAWNLPLATKVTLNGSVDWLGLVLAPNAELDAASNGQIHGQLIGATIPSESRTLTKVPFTGCLPQPQPPTPPDDSLTLTSLCVNAAGDATMRLRNTGDQTRTGRWVDLGGKDFDTFSVPAHNDLFFTVDNPGPQSVISATSGTTTVSAPVDHARCEGQITVRLVTVGPAPAGTWDILLDAGIDPAPAVTLASGGEETVTVPGGYVPGAAPIDQVIGGVAYTVSVPDPRGGTATVSLNPIEILDGQHEIVTVTIAYEESGGGGGGPRAARSPHRWTRHCRQARPIRSRGLASGARPRAPIWRSRTRSPRAGCRSEERSRWSRRSATAAPGRRSAWSRARSRSTTRSRPTASRTCSA